MKFFLVIGRTAVYTYERNGQEFTVQNIEGSEGYPVESSSVAADVGSYLNALANEKNLGTKAKLEFDVIEGADRFRNEAIGKALKEYAEQTYPLAEALRTACQRLSRDRDLHIDRFGINYEGHSYRMVEGDIVQGEFDLLAFTINSKDVLEMMKL